MSGSRSTTLSHPVAMKSSRTSGNASVRPTWRESSDVAPNPPPMYGVLVSANQYMTLAPPRSIPSVAAAARC